MAIGLALLIYSLGQKALHQALALVKQTIGMPTATPLMR